MMRRQAAKRKKSWQTVVIWKCDIRKKEEYEEPDVFFGVKEAYGTDVGYEIYPDEEHKGISIWTI